jgi:hypothetical protein
MLGGGGVALPSLAPKKIRHCCKGVKTEQIRSNSSEVMFVTIKFSISKSERIFPDTKSRNLSVMNMERIWCKYGPFAIDILLDVALKIGLTYNIHYCNITCSISECS